MSINTISRFVGAVLAIGVVIAFFFFDHTVPFLNNIGWLIGVAVASAVIAFIISPYISVVPYRWMRETSASDLVAAVIGLIVGLIISFLIAIPLANLPGTWGRILPFVGTVVCGGLGLTLAVQRKSEMAHLFQTAFTSRRMRERDRDEEREKEKERGKERDKEHSPQFQPVTQILLDTSAIIDGRIADTADTMRRNRGRRGLDMLNRLQKEATVPIEITDADVEDVVEVDGKLVKMARTLHCPIITNDFNLNRVAELQGVKVLNINELANAVKPVMLPGEDIHIKIMQDGKELGQGVGYLDDGTMIVVEGGRQYMGMTIEVTVTRVLQTVAGRMIFAHPKQGSNGSGPSFQPPPKLR